MPREVSVKKQDAYVDSGRLTCYRALAAQTTTISGDGCVFFKNSVSKPLWLGGVICNNATMVGANACAEAPDSEGYFRYVCPAK